MNTYLMVMAVALTLLLFISLLYVLRATNKADCLLSTQLISTIGVAILAILSVLKAQPYFLDIALVLALLASITVIAFTQLKRRHDHD